MFIIFYKCAGFLQAILVDIITKTNERHPHKTLYKQVLQFLS